MNNLEEEKKLVWDILSRTYPLYDEPWDDVYSFEDLVRQCFTEIRQRTNIRVDKQF